MSRPTATAEPPRVDVPREGSTIAIVQARLGSTRLPGKVLADIAGRAAIDRLLDRLAGARRVDAVWVATSREGGDDALARHLEARGTPVFRGSERDVLGRFAGAARAALAGGAAGAATLVRLTGDCPLIDPAVVDAAIAHHHATGADYTSNVAPPSYPDGLDTEVFAARHLFAAEAATDMATDPFAREHVTPWLRSAPDLARANLAAPTDRSALRLTLDEPEDLTFLRAVFAAFAPRTDMGWEEVADWAAAAAARGELDMSHQRHTRDEGAALGTGQKLWRRAKRAIPGGGMLLSKRAEMFLPDRWPAYFERAAGCTVWDLDGRAYRDMALMGVGTNTLGYGHPEVDAAVMRIVQAGNMSSLHCPEEVHLAERLCALHPWAEMARFTRSGGEANAVAMRIARAASGRDGVAICGYHGWHDWYLATNLGHEKGLDGHLLPGLDPAGVPRALAGTIHPFRYNDLDALTAIVRDHEIGVIKMEVMRNAGPAPGFLEGVRALADAHGIVLVFDECTSGFRQTFGGLHLEMGVAPDLAVLGKTLGNGYAINAVIGRRGAMEAAQSTFISSTFWTERIGPGAALAALDVMEATRSWEAITETGRKVRALWHRIAEQAGLEIATAGLPAIGTFAFDRPDALHAKTLFTQEMLARGWLATTACYTCLAHDDAVLAAYEADAGEVFATIAAHPEPAALAALLEGPVAHAGFQRLN
ncbi:MAG: aminotransferase class III-fold pyridoxal phosphate-dependent enzyme [Shimia sp.]